MDDERSIAGTMRGPGQYLTKDEAGRAGIHVPEGASGVTLYGARVDLETLGNQAAVATHNALHWQQEATRLNTLVHALRRELEAAKQTAGRTVIQSLLTTLEHCEPFVRASRNNFIGSRVDDTLAAVAKVRAAAVAALEHIQ